MNSVNNYIHNNFEQINNYIKSVDFHDKKIEQPNDIAINANKKTDIGHKIKKFIIIVLKIITIVGLIISHIRKIKNQQEIKTQLKKLKWSKLVHPQEVRKLLEHVSNKKALKRETKSFISQLPENVINEANKRELLELIEKGHTRKAYKLLNRMLFLSNILERIKRKNQKDNLLLNQALSDDFQKFIRKLLDENRELDWKDKETYKKLLDIDNRITTYQWLQKLKDRKEITKNEKKDLIFYLRRNNRKLFSYKLREILKTNEKTGKGSDISYVTLREFRKNLSKKSKDPFVDISNLVQSIKFYRKLNKNLNRLHEKIDTCVQNVPNDIEQIQNFQVLKDDLEALEKDLEQLVKSYLNVLEYDIKHLPEFTYGYFIHVGSIRNTIAKIDDGFARLVEKIEPNDDKIHRVCTCHYGYEGVRTNLVPIQQVDVVKSIHKLKKINEELGREICNICDICKIMKELNNDQENDEDIFLEFDRILENVNFIERKLGEVGKQLNSLKELKKIISNQIQDQIENVDHPLHKKKVLIITCSFGNGHNTAAQAIAKYFGKHKVHVGIADFTKDVLLPVQVLHKLGKLLGKNDWNCTIPFNFILKHQLYKTHRYMRTITTFFRKLFGIKGIQGIAAKAPGINNLMKDLIRKRFLLERPDHIITVYHMHMNPILEVAQEMGIPLIHMATDYDVKASYPFGKVPPDYKYFKFFLPNESEKVKKSSHPLRQDQIVVGGYPIRPEFFIDTPQDTINQMRAERGLDDETKVVLIMGGGGGQKVPFAEIFAKSKTLKQKLHIVVIAGGNNEFGDYLNNKFKTVKELENEAKILQGENKNVTIEVVRDPSTETDQKPYYVGALELSRFMDMGDAIISKTGGASTAEIIYKGIPVLFDHRIELFKWELKNLKIVKKSGRGYDLKKLKELEQLILKTIKLGKDGDHRVFKKINTRENVRCVVFDQIQKAELDPDMRSKRARY